MGIVVVWNIIAQIEINALHSINCIFYKHVFVFCDAFYNLVICVNTLQWCHNERKDVWNHQPRDFLFSRLFRHRSKHLSSASLAFVRRIHLSPVNSPHKGPATRKMCPFHDVIMIFRKYGPYIFKYSRHLRQCLCRNVQYKTPSVQVLTHLPLDKMVANKQTIFSGAPLWMENKCNLIKLSVKFVPNGQIDNDKALV